MKELDKIIKEIENTQVVILAGGRATRMDGESKPLLKIGDKTLLEHTLESYECCGFTDFKLLVGYKKESIKEFIGDGSKYNMNIEYSDDPEEKSGKGKALKNALNNGTINQSKRSIISYPDDLFFDETLSIRALLGHNYGVKKHGTQMTLVLVPDTKYPYGFAKVDERGIVTEFKEKPRIRKPTSTGMSLNEPEVYDLLEDKVDLNEPGPVGFESIVQPHLAKKRKLYSYFINSKDWIAINTPKAYKRAKRMYSERENN